MLASLEESVGDVGDLLSGILLALGAASIDNIPSSSLEAKRDILSEAVVDGSVDSDLRSLQRVSSSLSLVLVVIAERRTHFVAVVDKDEVIKTEVTGNRNGYGALAVSFRLFEWAAERISPS